MGLFCLWLIFVIFTLPMLVAWATPFTYAEVIREARLAMITAFATGTVLSCYLLSLNVQNIC